MTAAPPRSRVPTLAPILRGAARGLRRMPLTIASAAVATASAIMLAEPVGNERVVQSVLWSALLGIPLFTGLRLLAERFTWRPAMAWLANVGGLLVLGALYAVWGTWSDEVQATRLFQLLAAFLLFVAEAPYVIGPEGRGFWAYNRALFERVVVAGLYALVLFVGAAIALAALDNLFGVDLAPNAYLRLWFVAALFLMPWFFVAGLPADWSALEAQEDYPRELRVFTRFALLPIVALYLLMLLAYFVKVLVTWQWPSGWIGWLVSVVAVAGIFSLLLVHPLANRPGDRWVGTYARGFYLLLLPAIVMLWLAIWQRVSQYGITERRFFLIGLSIWLAGIAVYQLLTRARGIRVIPASLCVVGLVTFAGPWGAYRVSERSQAGRLAGILARDGMLVDGRAVAATGALPAGDRREITAILDYLGRTHGYRAVAAWFPDSLKRGGRVLADPDPRDDPQAATRQLMGSLGVAPVVGGNLAGGGFHYVVRPGVVALPTDGVAFVLPLAQWSRRASGDTGWTMWGDSAATALVVARHGAVVTTFSLSGLLAVLDTSGAPPQGLEPERLVVEGTGAVRGWLYLRRLAGRRTGSEAVVTDLVGTVLLADSVPAPR